MSKLLCTFSGKFGDVLWSLPTVRQISRLHGTPVDMGIMPQYRSLLTLLQLQPYIDRAFTVENWICMGSPWGDQPWQPPADVEEGYEKVYHLTYRNHPSSTPYALVDFIAWQQGIALEEPVCPFIMLPDEQPWFTTPMVTYAFNELCAEEKKPFLDKLVETYPDIRDKMVNVAHEPWTRAAGMIRDSVAFIGCRSSNLVLANGVGQTRIFVYEPLLWRTAYLYSNPHMPSIINPTPQPDPAHEAGRAAFF